MATWRDVKRFALALPGASEGTTSSGNRAWIVNKRLFVWERPLLPSDLRALGDDAPDGPILGMRTADLEMKEALLRSDPDLFFTTPHFDGYPAVLIRLGAIAGGDLKELIVEAWLARAQKRAVSEFLRGDKSTAGRKQRA